MLATSTGRSGAMMNARPALLFPEVVALRVVALGPRGERLEVVRVVRVQPLGGRQERRRRLAVGPFAGEDHEGPSNAGLPEGPGERDRVGGSPVEVEPAVYPDDARDDRQARRCAQVVGLLRQTVDGDVVRAPEEDVADRCVEARGACVERRVVEGVKLVLHVVVEERRAHDVARRGELVGAHVPPVVAVGEVDAYRAADLPRDVARPDQRARRDSPYRSEAVDAVLEQDIEDARREHAAEPAPFEDQGS